jgi:biotin carboxylase
MGEGKKKAGKSSGGRSKRGSGGGKKGGKQSGRKASGRKASRTTAGTEASAPAATATATAFGDGDPGRTTLRSLSDVYRYFRENTTPIYFISPTPYNLLGIDEWVGNFHYITYFDSFDGAHARSYSPAHAGPREFESFESVNAYLLGNKEVIDTIKARGPGQAVFVMFDEETEQLAHELGLEIALPPRTLREKIDSKVVTTELGNRVGVASVPNVLGRARTYRGLRRLANSADLGHELVVQTPYGDSGRTTFFISSEADWDEYAESLVGEELKVMRRINHFPGTVEAVATRHGTMVGPIQTDITGFAQLTPYRGGWCGNDVYPGVFDAGVRDRIRDMACRMGAGLYEDGYRGVFCLDFLLDTDDGTVYLGEVNPRISGASPLTQLITARYGGVPLFLFHLLEFADVEWELDLDEIQSRWQDFDRWTQLVLKQVTDEVQLITEAPASGLWRMADDGSIRFVRAETDWHNVGGEDEAFYLRVHGVGEYRYPGADIGILVTRDRMQTDSRQLLDRGVNWALAIGGQFQGVPPEGRVVTPQELLYAKWF